MKQDVKPGYVSHYYKGSIQALGTGAGLLSRLPAKSLKMSPANHVYSAFAFFGFILPGILLPMHFRARNIGTCLYIAWTSLLCLVGFLNSILWNDNVTNRAPVWCDISSRLLIGGRVAVPAASVCIVRRLHLATSACSGPIRNNTKQWRGIVVDLSIVMGIPILSIILAYIPQYQRFFIFEEVGCYFAIANVTPAFPLFVMWPAVIGLVLIFYMGLVIRTIIRRKANFQELLGENNNHLIWDQSHYWRLLTLVVIVFLCSFPPGIYDIIQDATLDMVQPWVGWDVIHANISEVVQYTSAEMRSIPRLSSTLQWARWCYVVYALTFFTFFAFTEEARRRYRNAFLYVTKSTSDVYSRNSRKMQKRLESFYSGESSSSNTQKHKPTLHLHVLTSRTSAGSLGSSPCDLNGVRYSPTKREVLGSIPGSTGSPVQGDEDLEIAPLSEITYQEPIQMVSSVLS
ncbi:hypothetical protein SERLA73DRAFT_174989 [Serpula lacrymans var. lacrymans S7.3]|uniref:Uncharacterized protein n=2 Tax=Serpula lacrymans var. lacrymans TaxID=341189 RepID=F8PJS9_SERL3|nr:fungal pheromone STE3 GPCR [Serpula lacrymans var. lacrymans S7.9]EGO03489.1 hypothetical protein SERLA73DRAFT_174989 [Serpula lacrymans var. lacrymans S7.3]EGO29242.1 fungal pheromone STE3 GPCR [Serpula lacrymans var. lacrymans S7.9]